ncbi:MAG: hypothetical protein MMC33_010712, partial [Icmadophila ericetorum]|nr:hypothetical protein [Icmadophila ericetorum]
MTTGHSHVFSEDEEKSGFRTIWYKKNFEHPVNYLGEKLRDVMDEANAGGYPSPKPKATPKPKPEHVESPLINGKPGTRKNLGFKDLTTLGAEVDRWGLSILFYNDIENDQDLSIKLYFEVSDKI